MLFIPNFFTLIFSCGPMAQTGEPAELMATATAHASFVLSGSSPDQNLSVLQRTQRLAVDDSVAQARLDLQTRCHERGGVIDSYGEPDTNVHLRDYLLHDYGGEQHAPYIQALLFGSDRYIATTRMTARCTFPPQS